MVDYLGFHITSFTYISLLLFALIVFIIIMIATEKERQRRHHTERLRIMKKHAELKMMNDMNKK
jgi:large-conductance mechanosensitive channel